VTAPAGCVAAPYSCAAGAAVSAGGSIYDQRKTGVDPGKLASDTIKGTIVAGNTETGGAIGGVRGKIVEGATQAVASAGSVKAQGGSNREAAGAFVGAAVAAAIPGKQDDAATVALFRNLFKSGANEAANRGTKCVAGDKNCN